jgi:hypothetical protein
LQNKLAGQSEFIAPLKEMGMCTSTNRLRPRRTYGNIWTRIRASGHRADLATELPTEISRIRNHHCIVDQSI